MIGLYYGRFNPVHKGHLQVMKDILSEVDTLIVVIGSPHRRNLIRDPFDGMERKKMIAAYLKESRIDACRIKIVIVPDGKSFSSTVTNLFKYCGKFDLIYCNKKTIIRLIEKKTRVKDIPGKRIASATKLRDAIANDKEWEHYTGKSVAKLIRKFNGIERIKKAYDTAER